MTYRNYRELTSSEFIDYLNKDLGCELGEHQEDLIKYCYNDVRFVKTIRHQMRPKGTFIGRLTLPFAFLISILIYLLVCPIKYLFTGKFYFSDNSKLYHFIEKRFNKAGLYY